MTTQITEYSRTEAALADLAQRYKLVVFDTRTAQGFEAARKARAELRTYRTDLEKLRVEIKAPALERCRQIDSEARRITAELESLEAPIDQQIKREEERREAERQAKVEAERKRLAAHREKIDAIKRRATDAIGKSSAQVQQMVGGLGATQDDPDWPSQFEEFTDEAVAARDATLEFLADLHDKTLVAESEAAKIKAEREQLERDKAAQAQRDAEERERREAAEREAQAKRDREDAERRQQEEAEQQRRREEIAATERRQAQEREALAQQRREQDERQRQIDAEARRVEEARVAQEREQARQEAAHKAEAERKDQERQAGEQRIREAEARAARRRELVKAARRDSPEAALYEIAGIVVDTEKPDDIAREEIGVLCEANLPEKAGGTRRKAKPQQGAIPIVGVAT